MEFLTQEFGGLTVFSELTKMLPNEDMIYLGDTKQFPYGNKSRDTIIEISKKNIEFLIKNDVKAVVIACGTATSQALDEMNKIFDIPIIGIIEPTVLSLKQEKVHKIGVIATTGTIRSKAWEEKIKNNIENVEVINKACPLLAQMAEEGWTQNEIAKLVISEYVSIFKENPVEKLILGCTHYPLFSKLIKNELGENTQIIDTGKNAAIYLKEYIKQKEMQNGKDNKANYKFYLTDLESNFVLAAENILKSKQTFQKVLI